jgi:hypothetical protein
MTPTELSTEDAVRRELLRIALVNSARSVPLQLVAVAYVAWQGWINGNLWAAALTAGLGIAVGVWRVVMARRYADVTRLDDRAYTAVRRETEANSLLAGLMWAFAAVSIYAHLTGADATAFIVISCGSVSMAAFFMPLVGNSYAMLSVPQIGGAMLAPSPPPPRRRSATAWRSTRRWRRSGRPRKPPKPPTSPSRSSWPP